MYIYIFFRLYEKFSAISALSMLRVHPLSTKRPSPHLHHLSPTSKTPSCSITDTPALCGTSWLCDWLRLPLDPGLPGFLLRTGQNLLLLLWLFMGLCTGPDQTCRLNRTETGLLFGWCNTGLPLRRTHFIPLRYFAHGFRRNQVPPLEQEMNRTERPL